MHPVSTSNSAPAHGSASQPSVEEGTLRMGFGVAQVVARTVGLRVADQPPFSRLDIEDVEPAAETGDE
ncbi:hypothetical protein [Sphingomonas sp. Leaf339]|uniref:hypothetical protein n=1 Tax=Sphingomonas sp. Leaf339 TaxID=1736343 RepID=UPI0006F38013|nr:hypothetical protein [Sphingomonas sp. Leaf339]